MAKKTGRTRIHAATKTARSECATNASFEPAARPAESQKASARQHCHTRHTSGATWAHSTSPQIARAQWPLNTHFRSIGPGKDRIIQEPARVDVLSLRRMVFGYARRTAFCFALVAENTTASRVTLLRYGDSTDASARLHGATKRRVRRVKPFGSFCLHAISTPDQVVPFR